MGTQTSYSPGLHSGVGASVVLVSDVAVSDVAVSDVAVSDVVVSATVVSAGRVSALASDDASVVASVPVSMSDESVRASMGLLSVAG
jgi:hypothetical protein